MPGKIRAMSKQFEHLGETHFLEWGDIGYSSKITLSAGYVGISIYSFGQNWESAPLVQGRAQPGHAPEFYPPSGTPGEGCRDDAVRRSMEVLEDLRKRPN